MGGMFRGFSTWFGPQQPAGGGCQSQGDEQPERDAPPEPHSEAVAESAEKELFHQARGLGGESPLGPAGVGSARNLRFHSPGARPNMIGVVGWGRKVCLARPVLSGQQRLVRNWAKPSFI